MQYRRRRHHRHLISRNHHDCVSPKNIQFLIKGFYYLGTFNDSNIFIQFFKDEVATRVEFPY